MRGSIRLLAICLGLAASQTSAAGCDCSGQIDTAVRAAFAASPAGGSQLASRVRELVASSPSLARHVVCAAQSQSPPAADAAAVGLAQAGLDESEVAASVCCGGDGFMLTYYEASGSGPAGESEAPQCLEQGAQRAARGQLTRLLTPNFSGAGNLFGAGGYGGAGGGVITQALP